MTKPTSTETARSADKYDDPAIAGRYHAVRYGDFQGRVNWWYMRRALGGALARHVPAGGRVLDMPCGTGQYSWHLAGLGYRTVAADIAPEMVKTASTLLKTSMANPPEFRVENVFQLSFPTASFDAAICIRLFNLLERPERIAALQELGRVGKTVIASYNHRYTLKHFSRSARFRAGLCRQPKFRFSRSVLLKEIGEAGFELKELISVAPVLSEVWLAVLTRRK